ncbi:F0F1 ATP synthase subunit B [Buchnera aphidicola (Pemphigus obesinymphae)]|uniref:ATP synthase subunit b n=1 Tax=Buchnera aphidicola TaxID=9 RepID=Q8KH75_9GAMM|nr:F0F1 ATP synthase subunit B [Buchnera aphidicola]AAM28097.1 ATP synthase subunit b [Buchnera aphidicola]AAM28101.1 ATP synthase subunit b [Buchnera aphidicola]MCW5196819.1 F0F1 ATP synthase subunit B [Buchnera aphidicola (Pemphigus obesinymphae)]
MNLNSTILGQSISFFLFVWFCMKYIWPPILITIEKRQKDISDSLNFVKKEKENLKIDQEKVKKEIKNQRQAALNLLNEAKKQRNIILEEARKSAEKEKNKFMIKARSDIDLERIKMQEELTQYVGKIAISIAEKVIQRSIKKNENNDIMKELINRL